MIYLYDSYIINANDWKELLTDKGSITVYYINYQIRNTEYDCVVIGLIEKRETVQDLISSGFDGYYTYFASNRFTYGSNPLNWNSIKQRSENQKKIFIPSVGPGYIDTNIRQWNGENTKEREDGKYYERYFDEAKKVNPTIISITSFNEWHEGTQIEPAIIKGGYKDYGEDSEKYLKITKDVLYMIYFSLLKEIIFINYLITLLIMFYYNQHFHSYMFLKHIQ